MPDEMVTVGWLLRKDSTGVHIANEYCEGESTYDGEREIPLHAIRSLTDIRTGESL